MAEVPHRKAPHPSCSQAAVGPQMTPLWDNSGNTSFLSNKTGAISVMLGSGLAVSTVASQADYVPICIYVEFTSSPSV